MIAKRNGNLKWIVGIKISDKFGHGKLDVDLSREGDTYGRRLSPDFSLIQNTGVIPRFGEGFLRLLIMY